MGRSTSIADVGMSIVKLLRRELVPDTLQNPDAVGLCSPTDRGDYMVGIHLYDIRESEELRQRQAAREQLEIYCNELSSYLSTCAEQKPELEAECGKDRAYLAEIETKARSDCVLYPVAEYEKERKVLQGRIAFYCTSWRSRRSASA